MAITTDIFGISELVTQSGTLGEYRTSSEIRIRFVIENAGLSSAFTIYGRIKGQTAWNSITTLTANEIKDVTVAEYDFVLVICDTYSSTSNHVRFLASGIAQSDGGLSTITAGGNVLTGLENISLSSTDTSVTITSNTSTGVIDFAVAGFTTTNTKIANLITLSGVAANATNLGIFTGSIIADNSTNKAALQALETSIGALPDPMEYKGLWSAATNTPTLTNVSGNNGDTYQVTADGSVNFGNGVISFVAGDKVVYNGAIAQYEKWDMTDAVASVNGYIGAVTLVKADLSLGNVDNTSDATKNAASVTLTNKIINASSNTISNLTVTMLASGVLDTDISSTSGLDDTLPSAKAVKSYVDTQIGVTVITGDIAPTSFTAANNQAVAANVTGFVFNAGVVRTFSALVSVSIVATANLYETFSILGLQKNGSFDITIEGLGDVSGVVFTITTGGQFQYQSSNVTGFVSSTIKFRAVNLGI